MDKKISISQLKEVAQEAYEQVKGNTGGKKCRLHPLPCQHRQESVRHQHLSDERTNH